jgi:hypothetical protein
METGIFKTELLKFYCCEGHECHVEYQSIAVCIGYIYRKREQEADD